MPDATDFLGGFVAGTQFMMANGERRAIETISVGDQLMKDDGTSVEVTAVPRKVTETVTIDQATKHTAHKKDPTRSPPWGVFKFTCAKRQSFKFATFQVKKDYEKKIGKRIVSIHIEVLTRTRDGREITLVKTRDKIFRPRGDEAVAAQYIAEKMDPYPDNVIYWDCELADLEYLTAAPKTSTYLSFYPLVFEKPVLLPWLEEHFKRDVSGKDLEGMAWLLGFWVGNGFKRGPIFALHSEDLDVSGRLNLNAKLWGMDLIIKKVGPSDSKKANGYLHTYSGTQRNLYHQSPICEVLSGLGFWENGRRGAAKKVPDFVRIDQRIVREAFLAGLIDSDGSTRIQDNKIRVKIVTVLPPVRDAINSIARSLGLNVTVYFYHERVHRLGYHESDAWTFNILGGLNQDILQSILNRCSCERKKNPPIQYTRTRDVEEFEDQGDQENQEDQDDQEDSTVSNSIMDDPETAELENVTPDSYFEEQQGTTDGDVFLNPNRVNFKTGSTVEQEVIGLICSHDCHLLTSDQIVVGSSKLMTEGSDVRVGAVTTCESCESTSSDHWYPLPWDRLTYRRLCRQCSRSLSELLLKCYKHDCNHILKRSHLASFRRSGTAKIRRQIRGNQVAEGYPCTKCGDGIYLKVRKNDRSQQ
ncbi:LAFA_0C07360g1_1 [Lachancea sp. 'fantastica']|nr:LAFA_0C07360g1_1 [Lachancea sp. 'fantastica']